MKLIHTISLILTAAISLTGCDKKNESASGGADGAQKIKIGFLVKQPEEPWFKLEWKFAQQAGKDLGFEVIPLGVQDGQKTLSAIDSLAAQNAQGFVICTPDVKLGPAIASKAKERDLKFMSVDDRLMKGDQPMAEVHHVGISARKIGEKAGDLLAARAKELGWKPEETGVIVGTFDQLDTIKDRTEGAISRLQAAGYPNIQRSPMKALDIPSALEAGNSALARNPDVKHWLVCGGNDTSVIGVLRALEQHGFTPDTACGMGINGTDCLPEFAREKSCLYGSILLAARNHGYQTAELLYHWIKDGKEPALLTYTEGTLITRDNWKKVYADQGMDIPEGK